MKTLSSVMAMDSLVRQAIKMDKKSPINTVSEHTKIYDNAFVYHKRPADTIKARKKFLSELNIKDNYELRKFTAVFLAYSGDF